MSSSTFEVPALEAAREEESWAHVQMRDDNDPVRQLNATESEALSDVQGSGGIDLAKTTVSAETSKKMDEVPIEEIQRNDARDLTDILGWLKKALPVRPRPEQLNDRVNLCEVFGVVKVLVSSDDDLDAEPFTTHWSDFMNMVTHARIAFVGIDAEWVSKNKASLIQIADTKRCFLFRSCNISMERLKPLLQPLLSAPNVLKCGVAVRNERKKLAEQGFDQIESLFELEHLIGVLPDEGRSLATMMRVATGLSMTKAIVTDLSTTTTSDWEAPVLTPEQQQYAADDAVAGVAIIAAAIEKWLLDPSVPHAFDDVVDAVAQWLKSVALTKPPPFQKASVPRLLTGASPAALPAVLRAAPRAAAPATAPSTLHTQGKFVKVFDKQGIEYGSFDKKHAKQQINKGKATVTSTDDKGNITAIQLLYDPPVKTKICELWKLGCCDKEKCNFAHGEEELVAYAKDSPPPPPPPPPPYAGTGCETFEAEEAPLDGAAPDVAVVSVEDAQDLSHHPCTQAPSHHDGSRNDLKNENC